MGDFADPSIGQFRLTIWSELNQAFSPLQIRHTKAVYDAYVADVGKDAANFVDFVAWQRKHVGNDPARSWVKDPGANDGAGIWAAGVAHFPVGVLDALSDFVARNFDGTFRDYDGELTVDKADYPRPIRFERIDGDRASLSIEQTQFGYKVVLSSKAT
ncbi:MAG: hypothetical protein H6983_24120 [Ectothiorhodospiraceae bacterium]|nr:hypothetical protein [Chromatiales bacterium]MCP5157286.1 hypothetical protein [Ectothiorhodospiraceae bacterium]